MGYGMHAYFPQPASYFTILREPVDRVISFYYFVRRNQQHYLYDFVIDKNLSLLEFLESKVSIMMSNFQVRLISGVWDTYEFGACPPEALETAKANLRDKFSVFGLTEAFDQTLLLLQQTYGWRNVFYTRHNVTANRPSRASLDKETLAAVEKANHLDVALYDFAQKLFWERWRQGGPALERRLRWFRLLNQTFYPWQQLYWHGRHWSARTWLRQQWERFK